MYFLYFEEISSSQCPNLGKYGQRSEQNKGNSFIVMHKKYGKLVVVSSKLTAKYGGYCQKLENKMVDIGGYLADILERI